MAANKGGNPLCGSLQDPVEVAFGIIGQHEQERIGRENCYISFADTTDGRVVCFTGALGELELNSPGSSARRYKRYTMPVPTARRLISTAKCLSHSFFREMLQESLELFDGLSQTSGGLLRFPEGDLPLLPFYALIEA